MPEFRYKYIQTEYIANPTQNPLPPHFPLSFSWMIIHLMDSRVQVAHHVPHYIQSFLKSSSIHPPEALPSSPILSLNARDESCQPTEDSPLPDREYTANPMILDNEEAQEEAYMKSWKDKFDLPPSAEEAKRAIHNLDAILSRWHKNQHYGYVKPIKTHCVDKYLWHCLEDMKCFLMLYVKCFKNKSRKATLDGTFEPCGWFYNQNWWKGRWAGAQSAGGGPVLSCLITMIFQPPISREDRVDVLLMTKTYLKKFIYTCRVLENKFMSKPWI